MTKSISLLFVDTYEIQLIFLRVKPSSTTDAYPGPELDDRPKFNVVIIYEDIAAGKQAKHFYDRVIRELVDESDLSLKLWISRCSEFRRLEFRLRKTPHRRTS